MEVYFDTAATSRRKPDCVYEAMDRFMREVGASPGRSVHGPGIEASRIVSDTREGVARLLGVADSSRVVFTLNCTEALNLAIKGLLTPRGHVVTTSVEHNSVMRPLSAAVSELGVTVDRAGADSTGTTDPDSVRRLLREDTALLVMTHASNVTGSIQPIEECGRFARECGVPFLVDAAQTAGCLPIDVGRLSADLLAFSGHKGLMGPQGVGGLYIREGIDVRALKQGGTGSSSSEETQPQLLPDKHESGTPNTPGLAGLGAALRFLNERTVSRVRAHVVELGSTLLDGLTAMEGLALHGPSNMTNNVGVFSFTVAGRDCAVLARQLGERYGIMTRAGLQCAPSTHRTIGTFPGGTIRASVGCFTSNRDVQRFLCALGEMCCHA